MGLKMATQRWKRGCRRQKGGGGGRDSADNQSMTETHGTWHPTNCYLTLSPSSLLLSLCGKYGWIEVCGSCGQLTMRCLSYHKLNRQRETKREREGQRKGERERQGRDRDRGTIVLLPLLQHANC